MPLNPPQAYRKTRFTHRRGTIANRPAATDVLAGTLYFATDLFTLYRSDGTTWETYSGASVVAPTQVNNFPYLFDNEEPELPYIIPGPQGLKGDVGRDAIGIPGIDGEDGYDSFIPGPQGIQGIQGIPGTNGASGSGGSAPPGIDGIDGEDAFYIPPTNQIITPAAVTFTTTGNIDDLDFSNSPLIRMNNASDATIRGLKAGYDGQLVTIISIGAGNLYTAHQNTNSTAGNRLINAVTSGNSPGAAGNAIFRYQYDITTGRWRLIGHVQGSPLLVPFNSGDYTANGSMTWTGNNGSADWFDYKYVLIGSILYVTLSLDQGSIGGTPDVQCQLKIVSNLGYSAAGIAGGWLFIKDAGTKTQGRIKTTSGGTNLLLSKFDQTNFTTQTNSLQFFSQIFFPVT